MEGDVERKPKTSLNNTQPTGESAGIVASKSDKLVKGLKFLTTIKKGERRRRQGK